MLLACLFNLSNAFSQCTFANRLSFTNLVINGDFSSDNTGFTSNFLFANKRMQKIWEGILDKTHQKQLETWDYQWTFSLWKNNGLAILPNINLVSNIGFDASALNTTNPNHRLAAMETAEMNKIAHPRLIIPDTKADDFSMLEVFNPTISKFAWQQIKRKFNK